MVHLVRLPYALHRENLAQTASSIILPDMEISTWILESLIVWCASFSLARFAPRWLVAGSPIWQNGKETARHSVSGTHDVYGQLAVWLSLHGETLAIGFLRANLAVVQLSCRLGPHLCERQCWRQHGGWSRKWTSSAKFGHGLRFPTDKTLCFAIFEALQVQS